MYPVTKIEIIDQSQITKQPINQYNNRPTFFAVFTSDKGDEDLMTIYGENFFKVYGDDISFARHGQPLLQAANIINSGGKLYCKRIVAPDSKLANIGIVGKVKKVEEQKRNEAGELLYIDSTTEEETTTVEGNLPVMVNVAEVSFQKYCADESSMDLSMVAKKITEQIPEDTDVEFYFPLFILTEKGRGKSNKKIRITPDYRYSRTFGYSKLLLEVIEKNQTVETKYFAQYPNYIEDGKNASLKNIIDLGSNQLKCVQYDDEIVDFMNKIEEILGLEKGELVDTDFFFGKTIYGKSIPNFRLNTEEFDLRNIYGNALENGDNGCFGDRPINSLAYDAEAAKVYNGTYSNDIYNLDANEIDVIFDANYGAPVKRAIEDLIMFRQDIYYFRDYGTSARTIEEFVAIRDEATLTYFAGDYPIFGDIYDPYTKKQITVTLPYEMVRPFIKHWVNGRNRPFAGMKYEVYFTDFIKGTLNFIPIVTPTLDQKLEMEDLKMNYCVNYKDKIVLDTCWTSNPEYSDLSWEHNVLAIQQIIKMLRVKCPLSRYSFIDGNQDLKTYQEDINAALSNLTTNFHSLDMVYAEDEDYETQKIFYAYIRVVTKPFVQSEYFKICVMNKNYLSE